MLRKGSKHVVWLLFALWTGFTFVGFFTPIKDLAARAPLGWGGWETFWVFFYALATWGNAGFLREQVCKYMCPYARFQSAMFDRNTLIIAYDPMRGEPRGPRKRGLVASVLERGRGLLDQITAYDYVFRASRHPSAADQQAQARGTITLAGAGAEAVPLPKFAPEQLGDCIDCTMCVQVCPTGIDIRNGLQYECIACGACIDACDEIMDKMGYPHGLIRYSTQNAIDGKPSRVLRPRIFIYGTLLLGLIVAWAWGVGTRSPLIAEVLRDRNALFRTVGEQTENGYTLKVINKTDQPQTYALTLETDTAGIALPGAPVSITAAPQEIVSRAVTLAAPASIHGRHNVRFVVTDTDDNNREVVASTFFGPLQ
jgi:polyferredoxin